MHSRKAHLKILFGEGIWGKWIGLVWAIYGTLAAYKVEWLTPQQQDEWQVVKLIAPISLPWWLAGALAVLCAWIFEASFRTHGRELAKNKELQSKLTTRRDNKAISDQLSVQMMQGKTLMGRITTPGLQPPTEEEVTAWQTKTHSIVRREFDANKFAWFDTPDSEPPTKVVEDVMLNIWWNGIKFRLTNLKKLVEELSKP
jgi:hypothetical protein